MTRRRGSSDPRPAGTGAAEYRPLVVAHRGASEDVAEHTLGAYRRAIDDGADALECDVRLTRDGHLVCVHDRRVERTSNGRGVVSEFALDELSTLDFGSWHPGLPDSADRLVDPDPDPERQSVLTFAELLALVVDAPRPLRLLVETKHPTRYAGLVERALVTELRRFGLHDPPDPDTAPVTVMSFSLLAVRRVAELAPRLPTVLLLNGIPVWLRTGTLPAGVRIAGPGVAAVTDQPHFVERVHDTGRKVYVWTVNDPADLDLVTSLRVDGIITDRPGYVLRRFGR
ncbi:glycerophosphodiester phosphodiesterase [Actinocatenispora rupis]|uniref:Glycerophosphoryl diester phosphodiesterase n=1 Tax=Actinocatenispora rupis TaxID=519421 RepID=A0A8J3NB93_9ACTN|nr:glycerophosphodiester phosphodiesterase family protein [Actinocatenispora rupis]GID13129.1 glycerophosphoryl diester phosphodiesterase [Actinocatenispora rupis]